LKTSGHSASTSEKSALEKLLLPLLPLLPAGNAMFVRTVRLCSGWMGLWQQINW
jgi:hypothetical protein